MRKFDFYEFAGVIAPGATLLVGLAILYPSVGQLLACGGLSLGDFGLFSLLAYVAGHLLQVVGNLGEECMWFLAGGWPTDWPRRQRGNLLAKEQIHAIAPMVRRMLAVQVEDIANLSRKEWWPIARQAYAAVSAAGRSDRLDVFNGNYGLCRGVAAAFFSILLLTLIERGLAPAQAELALLAGFVAASYRAFRFGRHYARELFVQFLQLSAEPSQETPGAPAK